MDTPPTPSDAPENRPGGAPEGAAETPVVAVVETPERPCANCAAAMEPEQDWCLECGTAAPGRLGGVRPGWRAVATTLGLTLVLVGGAGAASYAALSSDPERPFVAATPPPVGGATPTVAPVTPAPAEAPPPPVSVPAPTATTPPSFKAVDPPTAELPKAPTVRPVAPPKVAPPAPAAEPDDKDDEPPDVPLVTPPPTKASPAPKVIPIKPEKRPEKRPEKEPKKQTATSKGTTGSTGSTGPKEAPAEPELVPIEIGADAVSFYDPLRRGVAPGNPAEAADGDTETTFEAGVPDDGKSLRIGVTVDLQQSRSVRGVAFTTITPGGAVEVYGATGDELPDSIEDTRWERLGARNTVDGRDVDGSKAGDGIERIVFPRTSSKYRWVTLWFTAPPEGTTQLGVTELELLR